MEPHDFAFLDTRHLLVTASGEHKDAKRTVAVFDCLHTPSSRMLLRDAQHHAVLTLELPTPANRNSPAHLNIKCAPCCTSPSLKQLHSIKFRSADPSPAVLIGMQFGTTRAYHFDIVVPGRALFAHMHAAARVREAGFPARSLPWVAWMRDTRLFDVTERTSGEVCGPRYAQTGTITLSDDQGHNHDGQVLVLYHFDSAAAIKHDLHEEAENAHLRMRIARTHYLIDAVDCSDTDVWAEPVCTGAWARQVWTDIIVDENDSFYLTEDGVMVRNSPDEFEESDRCDSKLLARESVLIVAEQDVFIYYLDGVAVRPRVAKCRPNPGTFIIADEAIFTQILRIHIFYRIYTTCLWSQTIYVL